MMMDLETLAKIVEEQVPTTKTNIFPEANQIVVTFRNRPGVEVALLTPWLQKKVLEKNVTHEELFSLIEELNSIASF